MDLRETAECEALVRDTILNTEDRLLAHACGRSSAGTVSWVFIVSKITSSGRNSISVGSATQEKCARAVVPGDLSSSPPVLIASS
jgi:hypothetical protein